MTDKIMKGISAALTEEFGENYKIYTEKVEQNTEPPCFFIICNTSRNTLFLGRKYFWSNVFCIQYIPPEEAIWAEFGRASERLFECLEYIGVENRLLRGTKMESEIKDGVLYFYVNYDFFVYIEKENVMMENISGKVTVKGQVKDGRKDE